MRRKIYLIQLCFFLSSLLCTAQITSYECTFEDETENSQWVRNPGNQGPQCVNKWYIGSAASNGGRQGLYISGDGGKTAGYIENTDFTVVYRTLTLAPGEYELSFDWQLFGMPVDAMFVGWIPESQKTNCNSSGNIPPWVYTYALSFDGVSELKNAAWHTSRCTINSDGTPQKLVFMWFNGTNGVNAPGACIDNVNIVDKTCARPRRIDITADGPDVTVTWNGTASSYDFRCRRVNDTAWVEYNDYPSTSVLISDLGEGVYDVYVRSRCGGDSRSSWVSANQFIYYTGTRCVDYMDLNENNCYYGDFLHPDKAKGVIDGGYLSAASRHTLHYLKSERDPRTGNVLATVPPGEIASVRLGNWMVNAEAEMIEYDYHVDTNSTAILLLKYAVVLQNPGHDHDDQPRFTLRVIDEEGYDLGEDGCATADFVPGYGVDDGMWEKSDSLEFRDWSTMGINLKDYAGQNLKIRLTTKDCSQTAHYGYAYFAVGCASGHIEALSCGSGENNRFSAPDGFLYRWYREDTPEKTYSRNQQISVPQNDTATYYCEIGQLTNPSCTYTVSAKALPRYPFPNAAFETKVENCRNIVKCVNKSSVIMVNHKTNDTIYTETMCDGVLWDFGDGTTSDEWEPTHEYRKGGKTTVRMYARLADCEEMLEYVLDLPELGGTETLIEAETCYGTPYKFAGIDRFVSGTYHDTLACKYSGCDSIVTLKLTVHETAEIEYGDTVCTMDLPYLFGNQSLTETGTYTETFKTSLGCDSVVTLKLLVNESLVLDVDPVIQACANDSVIVVPYILHSGLVSAYDLVWADSKMSEMNVDSGKVETDNTLHVPLTKTVTPDIYDATFTFRNMTCGDETKAVKLQINYPDTILAQRWNDVVGVRSPVYNGGYDFVSYQWFKDGEPIPGQTKSNLYIAEGLDTEADYYVMLTRTSDNVTLFTCPIRPVVYGGIDDNPVVSVNNNNVRVQSSAAGKVRVWSVLGVVISEHPMYDGVTDIILPDVSGTYLLEFISDNGTRSVEKVMVRTY